MAQFMNSSYEGLGGYSYPPMPQGQSKIATQDGAKISYRIIPDNTICERRKQKDLKGTDLIFTDPQQLTMLAGDMVFQHQDLSETSEFDCSYDDNVFSVFNGINIPKNIWDCHAKFKFCGVCMDDFPYSPGSLAPIGVDVQISGVVNWVNGSNRTVHPGELITWIPDSTRIDGILEMQPPMKRRQPAQHSSVKARLIPLEETLMEMMYRIVGDEGSDITKNISWTSTEASEQMAVVAKTLGKTLSVTQQQCVGTTLSWKKLIPYLPVFFDRAIGKNVTPVASGGVGQMILRV